MKSINKTALLIRHGDRDAIPAGSFGNEVLLNEKGKQNAQSFGEKLKTSKITKIYTSPVERCVQTAEYIAKGYGKAVNIIQTTALGAPGLHINDEKTAGAFYLQQGFDVMYESFINGVMVPGVATPERLNQDLTDFINNNSEEKETTIFITHDMLIAFYHFSINKTVYTKENWVNYLSGITFNNGINER
ncbi:histidine phosphatase family protein [Flavobacterium sp.]|uniref:histidine phosphatase family protein n=1 Tax=Flavobacterium sp. TaxID=239 RepID=UPI002614BFA9|nr:histidine phosphatase family protein [Flavobacterium sp.]